ncbi:hypothetical protein ACFQ38_00260 [Sporosarcina contaminans]|uniref:Uncharacterized protein n=1 Tax=Sporosarcina contaminans TaxID=633403 RepID=A0ABW3TV62_9BACL
MITTAAYARLMGATRRIRIAGAVLSADGFGNTADSLDGKKIRTDRKSICAGLKRKISI